MFLENSHGGTCLHEAQQTRLSIRGARLWSSDLCRGERSPYGVTDWYGTSEYRTTLDLGAVTKGMSFPLCFLTI